MGGPKQIIALNFTFTFIIVGVGHSMIDWTSSLHSDRDHAWWVGGVLTQHNILGRRGSGILSIEL